MNKNVPSYLQYWGKAKKRADSPGDEYHLLVYHSLDVAAVGRLLLDPYKPLTKDLADFLDLSIKELQSLFQFFLALHDLGKFASAFQALFEHKSADLMTSKCCKSYDGKLYRHDRLGLYFWYEIERTVLNKIIHLEELNRESLFHAKASVRVIINIVLGHHGQPVESGDVRSIRQYTEKHNNESVIEFVNALVALLSPVLPLNKLCSEQWVERLKQVSWQLAGIAVLADWIGSDSSHFHYQSSPQPLNEYWLKAQQRAQQALSATDLNKPLTVSPFQSIRNHFGFQPTPLQRWVETVDIDASPQLFILEDVTGAGKTEAALALTHRLMEQGAADGFYFGLPTMATSNAMFSRVAKHYSKMLSVNEGKPSIVLAHGARDMNDLFREAILSSENPDSEYDSTDQTATAQCNHWLADSRKKALLAPVGVGTIDQALLAVLPRRHQSLRVLGLNRKVLIFDEVHAADEYMFELLDSLLSIHLHQGGSVILLTATLSLSQRSRLVATWQKAAGLVPQLPQSDAFPLATKVPIDSNAPLEIALSSRADVSREVGIQYIHNFDDCVKKVLEVIANKQCVVWIRNSVDDALKAYQEIRSSFDNEDVCLLFHSRFTLQDRKSIEDKVLELFGKKSNGEHREGKVLIATQVFQESLDADSDVMISDICPIDDLIQRAGRLHRHTRNHLGAYENGIVDVRSQPQLWLHCPIWQHTPESDWLSKDFRNTQYVYRSPGRLWLAQRVLIQLGAIRMPEQARQLIEAVYSDTAYQDIPPALQNQEDTLVGEERSKVAKANSQIIQWQYGYCDRSSNLWCEDTTDISSRHSDIETVEVLLLKRNSNGNLTPLTESDKFSIQLSTLKLSKTKYADKLQPLKETEEDTFKNQFPKAKYLRCWLPQEDSNFSYDSAMGFVETEKKEML